MVPIELLKLPEEPDVRAIVLASGGSREVDGASSARTASPRSRAEGAQAALRRFRLVSGAEPREVAIVSKTTHPPDTVGEGL